MKLNHFALTSDKGFNITHQPISIIDIYSASPLHSNSCVFRWFNFLIYHLQNLIQEGGQLLLEILLEESSQKNQNLLNVFRI